MKKRPTPTTNGKPSAHTNDSTPTSRAAIVAASGDRFKLSPRQARALVALRPGGWVSRERIDREAGSSNGPDVIAKLRAKLGYDAIDCERMPALDRDGKPCLPGMYRLTDVGRERLYRIEGRPAA